MFYKEMKYLAAHRVLRKINKSYIKWNGKNSTPSYIWVKFAEIKKDNPWFSNQILKDAAILLKKNSHADMLDNQRNIYDIEIGMLRDHFYECETAYREKHYIRLFLKSAKGLILTTSAIVVSIGIIWAVVKAILKLFQ